MRKRLVLALVLSFVRGESLAEHPDHTSCACIDKSPYETCTTGKGEFGHKMICVCLPCGQKHELCGGGA